MERIGIPIFESRVSPVLDSCNRLVLIDVDQGREVGRQEISLERNTVTERIELFVRWGIGKIICAGVSDLMCKYIAGKNITLISGIAGELDKILDAYICGRLNDACFEMPGKHGDPATDKAQWFFTADYLVNMETKFNWILSAGFQPVAISGRISTLWSCWCIHSHGDRLLLHANKNICILQSALQ